MLPVHPDEIDDRWPPGASLAPSELRQALVDTIATNSNRRTRRVGVRCIQEL